MSDFDDEPTKGADATADVEVEEPTAPAVDDDWDDDWDDDGDRGPKRDMTLIYAIVVATVIIVLAIVFTSRDSDSGSVETTQPGGATTAAAPPDKTWQGDVADAAGEAQKRAETAPGVYIWTDFGGWHLRSNNSKEVKVTVAADQVRVKKSDDGKDGDEDGEAPFATEEVVTLPAGDGKDGVGLDLGTSESATFTVTIDGTPVAPTEIKLGGNEGQADQNPITFTKS